MNNPTAELNRLIVARSIHVTAAKALAEQIKQLKATTPKPTPKRSTSAKRKTATKK